MQVSPVIFALGMALSRDFTKISGKNRSFQETPEMGV